MKALVEILKLDVKDMITTSIAQGGGSGTGPEEIKPPCEEGFEFLEE